MYHHARVGLALLRTEPGRALTTARGVESAARVCAQSGHQPDVAEHRRQMAAIRTPDVYATRRLKLPKTNLTCLPIASLYPHFPPCPPIARATDACDDTRARRNERRAKSVTATLQLRKSVRRVHAKLRSTYFGRSDRRSGSSRNHQWTACEPSCLVSLATFQVIVPECQPSRARWRCALGRSSQ